MVRQLRCPPGPQGLGWVRRDPFEGAWRLGAETREFEDLGLGDDQHVDGRVRRAQAQRAERRAQILLEARRVFAEKGYHGTSIQDIISAAGIARGTFYLYFEGKRVIFEEILDDLLIEIRSKIQGISLESEDPPDVQLLRTLERVLQVLVENRDLTVILLRQAVGLDPEFDQKLQEFYGRVRGIIVVSLTIGMDLGLVRSVDAPLVAACILGSVKEVLGDIVLQDDIPGDLSEAARSILNFNLHGVMT